MSNVIEFRPRARPSKCNYCQGMGIFRVDKTALRVPCPRCQGAGIINPEKKADGRSG